LIIDAQTELLNAGHDGVHILARLNDLIARAREAGAPVIYIQHDGGKEEALWNWIGSEGWTLHLALLPPSADEPVIHKPACDAFWRTSLHRHLASLGADHLVIAGLQTQF
ncbi:MAG: isochorismatase family protein, partial [Thermomicrobiales bacterium]